MRLPHKFQVVTYELVLKRMGLHLGVSLILLRHGVANVSQLKRVRMPRAGVPLARTVFLLNTRSCFDQKINIDRYVDPGA